MEKMQANVFSIVWRQYHTLKVTTVVSKVVIVKVNGGPGKTSLSGVAAAEAQLEEDFQAVFRPI